MIHIMKTVGLFGHIQVCIRPASVIQSGAHPTDDQEVSGSIIAGSDNICSWRLTMKYFYGHSLLSADSRMAVFSFLGENVHKNRLSP